jgi:hypothetical protein
LKKKILGFILAGFLCSTVFLVNTNADIVNPQFITLSLDDCWGNVEGDEAYKNDTGLDFLIALSTEIKAYALSINPAIEPPRVVMTLSTNAGRLDLWSYAANIDVRAHHLTLFNLGYQFTNHGHTHCSFWPGFMGNLDSYYLPIELKGCIDWFRYRLDGCHRGFAFRHGGNTCSTPPCDKWSTNCSLIARDIDCFENGWGTSGSGEDWPSLMTKDGFDYWYLGPGGSYYLTRIHTFADAATGVTSWMNTFDSSYNSGANPRSAVTGFFHDFDVSKAGEDCTPAQAEVSREILRQFLKKVLVDDNIRYNPGGAYENVYCITYRQYLEYYWFVNGMPESNYSSVQEIVDAGNMQRVEYSVEPSTAVEAESMARKNGGSTVSGGWKLVNGTDFIADIVNFPDENCTYAIDIVAKGTQGGDSAWPVAQVKMSAMADRLAKLSINEDTYFSEVGSVEINSTGWATYRIYVSFPVQLSDRYVYALANAVVFKLKNAGSGRELDIDRVTFSRASRIFRQGDDGYNGCLDMYYTGAIQDNTSEFLKASAGDSTVYLKFDVSSISTGSVVSKAYIGIYGYTNDDAGSPGTLLRQGEPINLEAYQADTNWSSKPVLLGAALDSKTVVAAGILYEFNVTPAAILAVKSGGGSLSIGIKSASTSGSGWYFCSTRHNREPKLRPVLKVMYSDTGIGDSSPPSNVSQVRDGTGSDIDSTDSNTQLSANWDEASDPESGILTYIYAIGTTAGGTDTTGWTNNSTSRSVTESGLTLTGGTRYYFSVKAINGAGLESSSASSDGQVVIKQLEDELDVKIYPSPYNSSKGNSMTFSIGGTTGGEVKIYTISGKLVKKLVIGTGESEVDWDVLNEDGNNITAGLYLYTIIDGEGNKKTGKLAISSN